MKSHEEFWADCVEGKNGVSPERERELAERIQGGCIAARNELVERNLQLALFFAWRRIRKGIGDYPIEDVIQAANLGLIRAADLFDPDKGRFSTYAGWWVRDFIEKELWKNSPPVRITVYHWKDARKGKRNLPKSVAVENADELV